MMRLFLLTSVFAAQAAYAYCPCYTLSSSSNSANCGVEAAPGTNPSVGEWQPIFELVARGPQDWNGDGPTLGTIGQGCGKPEKLHQVPARFPCELLKAIAMQESSWQQFCAPDRPSDQAGKTSRTIISFDCGYGVAQVTSGMHKGESPDFDRNRVASDPFYSLATGAKILASKWSATKCVGDNQPSVIENWYSAVWAYNGLAYVNNPSNPTYNSNRGVWRPTVGGSAPYQEKVFGRLEHPPSAAHWQSVPVAYPDPAKVGGAGAPPALEEPSCASPTQCATSRSTHRSSCWDSPGPVDAGEPDAGASPADDAGVVVGQEIGLVGTGCGCHALTGPLGPLGLCWLLALRARSRRALRRPARPESPDAG